MVARALRLARDGHLRAGTEDFAIVQRLIALFERNDSDAAILTEKAL